MNPANLFKFLEKEKGRQPSLITKLILGLPLTPEELDINDDLDLSYPKITFLPEGLKVKGWLDLQNTKITSLPSNLKIGKSLYLNDCTRLTSLSQGLEIKGSLVLENTRVSSLPSDLKVGGWLVIKDTPLANKSDEEIRAMLKTGYIKEGISRRI